MAIDNVVVSTGAVTLFDRIDQNNKTSTLTIQTSSGVTDVLTIDTPPAQSGPGAFSSLVSILAPRMAIDGLSGQQISDALNRLEQALQSLNPSGPDGPAGTTATSVPSFLTDGAGINLDELVSVIARAMIIQANSQEANSLQDALNARECARGELMAQADQLNKEASDMRAGALTQLIVGVTCSAISLVMSAVTLGMSVKNTSDMANLKAPKFEDDSEENISTKPTVDDTPPQDDPQKNDPPTTRKRSDAVSEGSKTRDERLAELNKSKETSVQSKDKIDTESKEWKDFQARRDDFQEKMNTFKGRGEVIQGLQSIGQTIAQIGNTAGSYVGTMSQALAKDDEAEGSRDAAEAQTLQSQADYANTLMQKASDNLKQIISFLQTVQESKSDEMRSITKG